MKRITTIAVCLMILVVLCPAQTPSNPFYLQWQNNGTPIYASGNGVVVNFLSGCSFANGVITCTGGGATSLSTLNGGTAPSSQTYNFATNSDVVNVVTQAAGDSSTNASSTAFVASAITNSQQAQVVAAHNYGVTANGRVTWTATTASGANTISCPSNDCNFTSADDGKICFATNASRFGTTVQRSSTVILPQGIFTHTGAQTGTCSGGNATSTLTATALFVWGSDDSAALATAWTAALAACATLQLPGVNPTATGPAIMLVQSAQLNATTAQQPAACSQTVGGSRLGVGVRGVDINSTFIIPTPSFDFTSCPDGTIYSGVKSCFLTVSDGINISDLSIFGAGNSNPGAGQSGTSIVAVLPANNAAVQNLSIMGWGANGTNGIGFGITFGGNAFVGKYINVDGAGATPCHVRPIGASLGDIVSTYGLVCYDGTKEGLWVDGNSATNIQPFVSVAGEYGSTSSTSGCIIGVSAGGLFTSIGDNIGIANLADGNGVCVGYAQAGGSTGAGTAVINGSWIGFNGASGSHGIFANSTGNTIRISNTRFGGAAVAQVMNAGAGATIYDLGGNTFTGMTGTLFGGSGLLLGSGSIANTALVVGNVATTSGWGTSPSVSAAAGNSIDGNFTVTTGTTASASPVATLTFPNAFAVAPTCSGEQIGGTQAQAFVQVGTPSTTAVAFTWTGTPANGATVQFHYHCWN